MRSPLLFSAASHTHTRTPDTRPFNLSILRVHDANFPFRLSPGVVWRVNSTHMVLFILLCCDYRIVSYVSHHTFKCRVNGQIWMPHYKILLPVHFYYYLCTSRWYIRQDKRVAVCVRLCACAHTRYPPFIFDRVPICACRLRESHCWCHIALESYIASTSRLHSFSNRCVQIQIKCTSFSFDFFFISISFLSNLTFSKDPVDVYKMWWLKRLTTISKSIHIAPLNTNKRQTHERNKKWNNEHVRSFVCTRAVFIEKQW